MYNPFTFSWIFSGLNKKFRSFLTLSSKNYAIWLIFECARAKTARKSWDLLHRSCWVTPQMATWHTSPRMEVPLVRGNWTLNIHHLAVTFFFVTARWCVLDNIHHLAVLTQFCYSARWCVLDNIHHLAVLKQFCYC